MRIYHIVFETTKLLLIALFIYTACSKLIGYYIFWQQLSKIPLLGAWADFLSVFVPAFEILIAGLLIFPRTTMAGWWLAAVLLSIFSFYVAAMMLFAPKLPCSCGGIISTLTWKQHLVVNIILATLCWIRIYQFYFITKFSMHTKGVS